LVRLILFFICISFFSSKEKIKEKRIGSFVEFGSFIESVVSFHPSLHSFCLE